MESRAYYNEFDPFAAQWLRNLIDAGLIAPGDVDERDIRDVSADDLVGYTQCHFFAGIGGWSLALRLAGWPDDRPVWTGSPPCQPFSTAGKGLGVRDERHLAPVFLDLVRECRPPVLFGEQVAAAVTKDGWLDALFDALEGAGYACGAAVVPACGVGAPHIRQRLWFVAERVADSDGERHDREQVLLQRGRQEQARSEVAGSGRPGGMADASSVGLERRSGMQECADQFPPRQAGVVDRPSQADSFWGAADWLLCRDGKWRPVEPGAFPLADGISSRVGRLRAYGNAIVPQVAAEVIEAFMEHRP